MTKNQAQHFYLIHKDKPFYNELTDFMSSGQCMVMVLEKDNAVEEWRNLIGSTDPEEAEEGPTPSQQLAIMEKMRGATVQPEEQVQNEVSKGNLVPMREQAA